jgi:hypothetical protein
MSTPAALGVYSERGPAPDNVRARDWRGAFHHSDGTPEGVGNLLIAMVQRERGFIARLVGRVIDAAPTGWDSLKRNVKFQEEPPPVGPADVDSICFAFVFDVAERRLDAFDTTADEKGQRIGSIHFSFNGDPTPTSFQYSEGHALAGTGAWLSELPESGWQSSDTADVAVRAAVAAAVSKACLDAGMPSEQFCALVSEGVVEVIRRGDWESRDSLTRVHLAGSPTPMRRVLLGPLTVHYSPRGRGLRTTIDGDEFATVVRDESESVEVNLRKRAVAEVIGTNGPAVFRLMVAALPTSNWLLAFLDYARSTQVPGAFDEPAPPK